jgi:hypothetical protein
MTHPHLLYIPGTLYVDPCLARIFKMMKIIGFILQNYELKEIDERNISLTEDSDKREEMLAKFQDFQRKADMYYAYHSIQRYTVSLALSFHSKMSEMYLNYM